MSQDVILEINSLTLTVGYKTLFREKQLRFPQTGLILLRGENGVGKSTLLKEIYLNSKNKKSWHWPLGKASISYLGHELGLYSSLSLIENLEYYQSLGPTPISQEELRSLINYYQLSRRASDPIYMFSRGMKQKAAIIRSFVQSPKILLLDEPFTGLDTNSIALFTKQLNREKANRLLVIVLHEIPKGLEVDDTIYLGTDQN
ncbi:ATP-binding cassette domain-containing protein [Leptospira ognonensis]|uniref:ATP-binding cassette domain-containing protein n=1 Tax=Leptospira ognonensis TaxID=2484945 RepID=A0A4R9JXQ4_9LEPT|nr:ATP-binding cassette domain-containing protein [Leptospira ognonensis]TGL57272.1 ATP-binding cassette domain-containing protein [Leptospira ognonensis]